jgi:single-strand DNA-binding protein
MQENEMNRVILVGNVGRDPQSFRGGVCTFSLATSEGKDAVEWHKIVCFKQQADFAGKYIRKGSMVTVEGRLSYSKYTKNGQDFVQAEIIADRVSFIGQRRKNQQRENLSNYEPSSPSPAPVQSDPLSYPEASPASKVASNPLTPEQEELLRKFNLI